MKDIHNFEDLIKSRINKIVINSFACWNEEDVFSNHQGTAIRFLIELPDDILREVLSRVYTTKDYVNVIAVCKKWHSIVRDLRSDSDPRNSLPFLHRLPKKIALPMMLQPYGEKGDTHYFYSISKRKVNKVRVPGITDKWICGSWRGWLATIDTKDNNEIQLVNPVTKVKIPLPSLSTFPESPMGWRTRSFHHIEKIVIVSSGVREVPESPSNYKIVALTMFSRLMYVCSIKDDKWKEIDPAVPNITDVIQYKGILYVVNHVGTLFAVETTPVTSVNPIAVMSCERDISYYYYCYLVEDELSRELLLIVRCSKPTGVTFSPKTIGFMVYKLVEKQQARYQYFCSERFQSHRSREPVRKTWEQLESLPNRILFVGCNRTLCLDSNLYPKCKGNCIYFTDDGRPFRKKMPHDCGVYDMSDKRIKYFAKDISGLLPMKAIWFSPNPW